VDESAEDVVAVDPLGREGNDIEVVGGGAQVQSPVGPSGVVVLCVFSEDSPRVLRHPQYQRGSLPWASSMSHTGGIPGVPFIGTTVWKSHEAARDDVFRFIEVEYNRTRLRRHPEFGYLTPLETRARLQQDFPPQREQPLSKIS
jgi:hypothetical protein